MISRLLCSPTLQQLYRPVRRAPVVGELVHRLVGKFLPDGTRVAVNVSAGAAAGLSLSVDPRYEAPYAAGDYEERLLAVLASHLGRGDVLYDVGAHVGFISMVAARLVGPEGKVYAFEADADNSKRIWEHRQMNSLPQIEPVATAVWSECTKLLFRKDPDSSSRNMGAVSAIAGRETISGGTLVQAVTLDLFSLDHRRPTAVKIDVEGAEEEVLAGAINVLRTSRPLLICEIHNPQAAEGVSRRLTELGYRWNWLTHVEAFPRHLVAKTHE